MNYNSSVMSKKIVNVIIDHKTKLLKVIIYDR